MMMTNAQPPPSRQRPSPENTPPELIFVELLATLTDAALPHLRDLMRGSLLGMEQQAICRTTTGRGVLVTLSLTALNSEQTTAALASPTQGGHA